MLNWVAILLHFRSLDPGFIKAFNNRLNRLEERFYIDVNKYDVIKGYRADDAYFRFPLDFVRGNLTLEQLEESFNLGNLGIEYALVSDKAISRLKYKESILSSEKYINRYFESIRTITKRFDELDKDKEGIRIRDILESRESK